MSSHGFILCGFPSSAGPSFEAVRRRGPRREDIGIGCSRPDFCFSTAPDFVSDVEVLDRFYCDSADHSAVISYFKPQRPPPRLVNFINYNKAGRLFADCPEDLPSGEIAEELYNCIRSATFQKVKRAAGAPPVWWYPACSKAFDNKRKARKLMLQRASPLTVANFQIASRTARNVQMCAEHNFLKELFAAVPPGSRQFYQVIKRTSKNRLSPQRPSPPQR